MKSTSSKICSLILICLMFSTEIISGMQKHKEATLSRHERIKISQKSGHHNQNRGDDDHTEEEEEQAEALYNSVSALGYFISNELKDLVEEYFQTNEPQPEIHDHFTQMYNDCLDALDRVDDAVDEIADEETRNNFKQQLADFREVASALNGEMQTIQTDAVREVADIAESEEKDEQREEEQAEGKENAENNPLLTAADIESAAEDIESAAETPALRFLELTDDEKTGAEKANEIQNAALQCVQGFLKNMPSDFCWKKGGDAGIIPNTCEEGYIHQGAMCYKECRDGYYHGGIGFCLEECADGYANHPLSCYKHFFNWYFKSSYITNTHTHFSDVALCPDGYEKQGALCYRKCSEYTDPDHPLYMESCGIGACAKNSFSCGSGIATIAVDLLISLGEMILFILSFGTSSGASTAIAGLKEGLKKAVGVATSAGKTAMKKAFTTLKKLFTDGKFADKFIDDMAKEASKWVKDQAKSKLQESLILLTCQGVTHKIVEKITGKDSPSTSFDMSLIDFTNVSQVINKCKIVDNSDGNNSDEVMCAKEVLKVIDLADPTGLVGMVAAFMQPICNV